MEAYLELVVTIVAHLAVVWEGLKFCFRLMWPVHQRFAQQPLA